jgi:hypothetical protein
MFDDMLECFCGNSEYKHYYYPKEKKIYYCPNNNKINNRRCKFFFKKAKNNNCINKHCDFEHLKDEELPVFSKKLGKYILNNNVYNVHIDENKILGWKNRKSYNERDERRIKTELPQYIIEENEYRSIVKSIDILKTVINLPYISTETTCYSPSAPTCDDKYYFPIIEQPTLTADSEWFENRSRKIKVNKKGVIYYIKKTTGEKSWIHPYTRKTNLPGGYLTPSDAGLYLEK